MIKCARCGTENGKSAQYCDECGSPLTSVGKFDAPGQSAGSTTLEKESDAQIFAVEPIISGGSWIKEIGNSSPATPARAKLIVERGRTAGKEFLLDGAETNIGRWDADNGIFPDVDLDADDPEAKVSRRHARILRENNQFLIEDLGSTNGTFINRGRRLLPGSRQILEDGDEIIVGKTFLRFKIV
ncbi:MAG: FHA domain-containing protein [Acidobacteriota bacterium]|nr:FHA domain-containing protein [Acidobacteriota bacterium]